MAGGTILWTWRNSRNAGLFVQCGYWGMAGKRATNGGKLSRGLASTHLLWLYLRIYRARMGDEYRCQAIYLGGLHLAVALLIPIESVHSFLLV